MREMGEGLSRGGGTSWCHPNCTSKKGWKMLLAALGSLMQTRGSLFDGDGNFCLLPGGDEGKNSRPGFVTSACQHSPGERQANSTQRENFHQNFIYFYRLEKGGRVEKCFSLTFLW